LVEALVVGLGNPGSQYAQTRHNIGFRVVDEVARRGDATFRSKYSGRFAETTLGGVGVALLEPETYMNLVGRPAAQAARFYKLDPADVIVVYDDIELAFDRVRARAGGGLKGHNGLRSMADALGTADFLRVRCGVGRPRRGDPRSVADYVLAPFYEDEDPSGLIERGADCIEAILRDGVEAAERAFSS
jgi:peptidyl-tRNA hydrolase, PTH1 family